MNTTRGLLSYLDTDATTLTKILLEKGYSDDVALSVYCNGHPDREETYRKHWPKSYENLQKSSRDFERDSVTREYRRRTPLDKGSDLACNFYAEDMEVEMLTQGGLNVTFNTTDAARSFIAPHKQSAEADCYVKIDYLDFTADVKLEIVNDWGSFWRDMKRCTLRNDKAYSCRRQEAIVVGFNLPNQLCFVRDAATLQDSEITKAFNFNGYDIPVTVHELDPAYIADRIKDIAKGRQ